MTLSLASILTDEERAQIDRTMPTLGKNPPGIDLGEVFERLVDAVNTEILAQVAAIDIPEAAEVTKAVVPSSPADVTFTLSADEAREVVDIWFVNTAGVGTPPVFIVTNDDTGNFIAGAGAESLGSGANSALHRIETLLTAEVVVPAGGTVTVAISGGDAASLTCLVYVLHKPA